MNQQNQPPNYPPCDEQPDPCQEPKEPQEPQEPQAQDPPCPEPKPCPALPTPPAPESCEVPTAPPEQPQAPCPPPTSDPCGDGGNKKQEPATPTQQLAALRKVAEDGSRDLQKLEPLKTQLADVAQRIAALEKIIEDQPAATAKYTEFFRATERDRSSIECSIQTIRCQLDLKDAQKTCIRNAVTHVDELVKKAQSARDAQNDLVLKLGKWQKKLEDDLAWATKWSTYFKTTLQAQVTAQREDLKKLMQLVDPANDHCEVWFYLNEIESLLRSARSNNESEACYRENLNVATFLDCWSPDSYATAYQYWIVKLNDTESAAKVGAVRLSEATKLATELTKAATDAETKRREWVLKELKTQDCCGPLSKCP